MLFQSQKKISDLLKAKALRMSWQARSEVVVFTSGCFDILHLGHLDSLEKAANFGTKLIVGVNTDQSIRNLKGGQRPINNLKSRLGLLAALACVSTVVPFSQATPLKLIETLKPDILVKGDDYTLDTIVGAKEVLAWGGQVKITPLLNGYSTTQIIKKCQTIL